MFPLGNAIMMARDLKKIATIFQQHICKVSVNKCQCCSLAFRVIESEHFSSHGAHQQSENSKSFKVSPVSSPRSHGGYLPRANQSGQPGAMWSSVLALTAW